MMIRINLLPAETKIQIPAAYKHLAGALILFLIGLAGVGVWYQDTEAKVAAKRQEHQEKKKKREELDKVIQEVRKFKETKKELERKLQTIQELKDNQKGPLRLLSELATRIPKTVWTSKVVLRKNRLSLVGFGLTLSSVGDLVENLKESPHFSDVDYERSSVKNEKGLTIYNFTIVAKFIPDPNAKKAPEETKERKGRKKRGRR